MVGLWGGCVVLGGGSEVGGLGVGLMDEGVGCGEGFEGLRKGYCLCKATKATQ